MDIRQLVAGSRLWLPVDVPGALFSIGDLHFAQGDGEVCGTAIEVAGAVTVRFALIRGPARARPLPRATRRRRRPARRSFATTGIPVEAAMDLNVAAREALLEMIGHLERRVRLRAAGCLRALQRRRRPPASPRSWTCPTRSSRRCSRSTSSTTEARPGLAFSGTAYDGIGAPVAPRSLSGKPRKANSYCFSAAISSMSTTSMICAPAVANMYAVHRQEDVRLLRGQHLEPDRVAGDAHRAHLLAEPLRGGREIPGVLSR